MAVYTQLGAETLSALINKFDVGPLVSAKGIAEGVSNSNWLIDTGGGGENGGATRFFLTMYEQRTDVADLPFFLSLLDHLSGKGCPVPRTIHDRQGQSYRMLDGKAVALIEFLPGVSVSQPTPAQASSLGAALATLHLAAADFPGSRANGLGIADWPALADSCGVAGFAAIDPALPALVKDELDSVSKDWPHHLPRSVIHADLFPDNVLMLGDKVAGLIDFYFACNDITAYDLAITHAAWCFDANGETFHENISAALFTGYDSVRRLSPQERAAMPVLARGAAMRFLLTRAYDWANVPEGALVARKDPMAFARRLLFYANPANAGIWG